MDFSYQDTGIAFHRTHPRSINMDEPGLGKTRQALLSAEGPVLVVCPAVIRDMRVWEDERDLWAPGLDMRVISYHELVQKQIERVPYKDGRKGPDGTPLLRSNSKFLHSLEDSLRQPWGTVIFDEAHRLKGHRNAWTTAGTACANYGTRVILLTGTPMPNWANEIFALLRILRPEDNRRAAPLGSYWRWIEKWFRVDMVQHRLDQERPNREISGGLLHCTPACNAAIIAGGCEHWEAFRREELGDLWIRRLRDDVLTDLPPLFGHDQLHTVPMGASQRKAYNALKRDMLAVMDDGQMLAVWTKAGQLVKLRQISTALETVSAVHSSGKLDAMCEMLENRTRPTLVTATYHASMNAIEDRLEGMGLRWREVSGRTSRADRLEAKDRFQNGDIDVMVGQNEVVSEGLTLTAGDELIIVEHSWVPSTNTQVMRRLHRPGQERPVTVRRLVSPGVDTNMQQLLRTKTEHQIRALPARDFKELL